MSGIYGMLALDGRPVAPELEAMKRAMAYWGPDGCGSWARGMAGLGHLKLLALPESLHEQLPFEDSSTGLVFTASARLDDREDLCDELRVPRDERASTPDTTLLLRIWVRRGEGALPRLGGDWSMAIWDPREERLTLARDPHGITALYYASTSRRFAFASSQKALLALPDVSREPEEVRLAQILTAWDGDGHATAYGGIRRLPPAHLLQWQGGRVRIQRYWRMEDVRDVRLASDEAYVEAFLEHFARAVRTRLRSVRPVGSMLSSGLDSGAVTALAARELGARGARLTALTSVPLFPPGGAAPRGAIWNEWPLAHALAERWSLVDHVAVDAAGCTPLDGIDRILWMNDEPVHSASNCFWIAAALDSARDRSLGVLLTGQMGNGAVSWTGNRDQVWRQLRAGRIGAATRDMAAWRRAHGASWPRALGTQLLRPLLGPLWAERRRLRHPFSPGWDEYSAINPAFARRIRLGERMRASGHDPFFFRFRGRLGLRLAVLAPGRDIVGAIWHEAGAAASLEARDPTADIRLVAFCLGIPDDQYGHLGWDRWLIRRGMEGLLPRETQWNVLRGRQAADVGHRLVAQAEDCHAWLDSMDRSVRCAEILDLPRMRRVLTSLQSRVTPAATLEAAAVLAKGLGVGRFLLGGESPGGGAPPKI